jgi:hypothetical protein
MNTRMPINQRRLWRLRRKLDLAETRCGVGLSNPISIAASKKDRPQMSAQIKAMEREIPDLRQANEILRKASAYFAQAQLACPFKR